MNDYRFEDLQVGMICAFKHTFSLDQMNLFSAMTGDVNPLHMDDAFAEKKGFRSRVVFGMLTASLISTLGGCYLPGRNCLIQGVEIQFAGPVYPGNEITVKGKITEIHESVRQIVIRVDMTNQDGNKVLRGKLKAGVLNG